MNLTPFLPLLFFKRKNISVTNQVFDLIFSMFVLNDLFEERVSQMFDLGLCFYSMSKHFLLFFKT